MTEYEIASNGERVSTRYAPGYFAMMRDFARNGHVSGSYGSSVVVKPKMDSRADYRGSILKPTSGRHAGG